MVNVPLPVSQLLAAPAPCTAADPMETLVGCNPVGPQTALAMRQTHVPLGWQTGGKCWISAQTWAQIKCRQGEPASLRHPGMRVVFERQQRWGKPGDREDKDARAGGGEYTASHLVASTRAGLRVAGPWLV